MSTTVPGNLHVANDVLADMVGNAALECYGVVGMTAPTAVDGIAKILPASRLRRGVVVMWSSTWSSNTAPTSPPCLRTSSTK